RVPADIDDYSLAQNFTRQVVPFVPRRGAPETVRRILITSFLRHCLRPRALIAEDSEVIADLDSLIGPKVYIGCVESAENLSVIFSGHYHGHRLAAYRREVIEVGSILIRRRWAIRIRHDDIPALHVIA